MDTDEQRQEADTVAGTGPENGAAEGGMEGVEATASSGLPEAGSSASVAVASGADASDDSEDDAPIVAPAARRPKSDFISDKADISDEEDEEDDEEDEGVENIEGLIDDAESSDEEIGSKRKKKRRRERRESDDELDDDDIHLINENLGENVFEQKKSEYKRLKRAAADSDDDDEEARLAEQLFDDGVPALPEAPPMPVDAAKAGDKYKGLSDDSDEFMSDEDDMMGFIVSEDEGGAGPAAAAKPQRKKKRRRRRDAPPGWEDAMQIFGVDMTEFFETEMDHEDEYDDDDLDDVTQKAKKPARRLTEIFEPALIEERHLSEHDSHIKQRDIPERVQLVYGERKAPDPDDLRDEAWWIFTEGFLQDRLTTATDMVLRRIQDHHMTMSSMSSEERVMYIQAALQLLHWEPQQQQADGADPAKAGVQKASNAGPREVPFIAQYRKELVGFPHILNMHDLWKIHDLDRQYQALKGRQAKMLRMCQQLCDYQRVDQATEGKTPSRFLDDADMDSIREAKTEVALDDWNDFLQLHFVDEIRLLRKIKGAKQSRYGYCRKVGLLPALKWYGLNPRHVAENLNKGYLGHQPEKVDKMPSAVALELLADISTRGIHDADRVLAVLRECLATEIAAEPGVREEVRDKYLRYATLTIRATTRGRKEIEDWHPYARFRYVTNKPLNSFEGCQFAWILKAEEEGLIRLQFNVSDRMEEWLCNPSDVFIHSDRDEMTDAWNEERHKVMEIAVNTRLLPLMEKEVRQRLRKEADEHILEQCANYVRSIVSKAPFVSDNADGSEGLRVIAISPGNVSDGVPTYAASLIETGDCVDYLRLDWLMVRGKTVNVSEAKKQQADVEALKKFLVRYPPDLVAIATDGMQSPRLYQVLQDSIEDLQAEERLSYKPVVHFVETNIAKVYMATARAQTEFPEYVPRLRMAISAGRRVQCPEVEVAGLFNTSKDILCVKMHPLQDRLGEKDLMEALEHEMVTAVNRSGLDINRAVAQSHVAPALQFISGLGPRKADSLMQAIRQQGHGRVYSREQLRFFGMGPVVEKNCIGFIKIPYIAARGVGFMAVETDGDLDDETEVFVDILDGTRIHPESYQLAYKIAVDARELTPEDGDMGLPGRDACVQAVVEVMDDPEALVDLNLQDFAEQLVGQGFGPKELTLSDIASEMKHAFRDTRHEFAPMDPAQLFMSTTSETIPQREIRCFAHNEDELWFHNHIHEMPSLQPKQIITCKVRRFTYGQSMDLPSPIQDGNQVKCSVCQQVFDSLEIFQRTHLEVGACPGRAVGLTTICSNGISGFVGMRELSDNPVSHPSERVMEGTVIHCRIREIREERTSLELTCKSSELRGETPDYDPRAWGWDTFYDIVAQRDAEAADKQKEKSKLKARKYTKRNIDHPHFANVGFRAAMKALQQEPPGHVILRPSSKGVEHLTASWKVTDTVYRHLDIKEEDKESDKTIGHKLTVEGADYEDLEEILATYFAPMSDFVRKLSSQSKYYREVTRDDITAMIKEEKAENPQRWPYYVSPLTEQPGRFILSYLPGSRVRSEVIKVTPDGYKFRERVFRDPKDLVMWFKRHWNDKKAQPKPKAKARQPQQAPAPKPAPAPQSRPAHSGIHPERQRMLGLSQPYAAPSGGGNSWDSQRGPPRPPALNGGQPRYPPAAAAAAPSMGRPPQPYLSYGQGQYQQPPQQQQQRQQPPYQQQRQQPAYQQQRPPQSQQQQQPTDWGARARNYAAQRR